MAIANMNCVHFPLLTFLIAALGSFPGIATAAEAPRPNVILILTDDQGYGDLACHGNPVIKTPNLDRLHAESVRFTNFHVDPTCSPTRGALMSGKFAHRAKAWHTIAGGNHLRASASTLWALRASQMLCSSLGSAHDSTPLSRASKAMPRRRSCSLAYS